MFKDLFEVTSWLLMWDVKGMVYTTINSCWRRPISGFYSTLKAEILQQAETDDHLTSLHGVGNFKHRQRMACQNAGGECRAPGNWARSVQRAHRHPTCDPTWKKVRISHHRNCQGPYQAPEAAIRSAWEEAYADLKWLHCYILQESPL